MRSIRSILVPVDFSERSRWAVREAASLADKFASKLILLHVAEPGPSDDYEGGEAPREDEAYEAEDLERLARAEAPDADAEVVVREGDVSAEIRRLSEDRKVDLIVMPTRGRGSYRRFLLGSNTAKSLHDAACPVLTGAHLERAEQACYPYRRIACLVDLKEGSARVLAEAAGMAAAHEAELAAIHMPRPFHLDTSPRSDFRETVEGSARLSLERLVGAEGVQAEIIVKTAELETGLPKLLEDGSFDLVVVARNAFAGGEEPGLTSEAYAVIRSSPCAVLSV